MGTCACILQHSNVEYEIHIYMWLSLHLKVLDGLESETAQVGAAHNADRSPFTTVQNPATVLLTYQRHPWTATSC